MTPSLPVLSKTSAISSPISRSAAEIAATLEARTADLNLYVVLDTLEYLVKDTAVWTEITTLLIPGKNDSDAELRAMSKWIREHLGADVPLHFTAFHPDYKLDDVPATPSTTLSRARRIAQEEGLQYVYTGNVHDREGGTTFCPSCRAALIVRDWHEINRYDLTPEGHCPHCATPIAGAFEAFHGQFGRRRIPVAIGRSR